MFLQPPGHRESCEAISMMFLEKKTQRHHDGAQTNHLWGGRASSTARQNGKSNTTNKKTAGSQLISPLPATLSKPEVTGQKTLMQTISGGCPGMLQQHRVPQQAQQAGTSCCKPCCKPPSTKTRQCSREMYTKARFRALAFIQTHPNHFGLLIPGLPNR